MVIALVFALTIPAAAANEPKSIEVTNREIKIVVDGDLITPVDASGNPVEPFIFGGTTYLPVRAVAGALGLSVDWDGETSTVLLTTGAEAKTGTGTPAGTNATRNIEITYRDIQISIDGLLITPTDASGNPVEPFICDGTTYLPVRAVASHWGGSWLGWGDEHGLSRRTAHRDLLAAFVSDGLQHRRYGLLSGTYTYDEYGRNTSSARHYPDDPDSDSAVTRTYEGWKVIFEDYGDGYSRYSYDEDGNLVSDKYYSGGHWRNGSTPMTPEED